MKRIALFGLFALLAACESNPTQPERLVARLHETGVDSTHTHAAAGAEWQRFTFPLRDVRYIECLGESVLVDGPIEVAVRTVVDGQGRTKVLVSETGRDVVQTGLTSGTVWRSAAGIENFTYHIEADGHLRMFQHSGVIRFLADRATSPDLSLKHFVHVQLNANGEIVVERTTPDVLECQQTGQTR